MQAEIINWVLTGVVGVLLMAITYYLKETLSTIKELGNKMNKAFIIITKHDENIESLKEKQNITDHRIARVEEKQDSHTEDLIEIKTKLNLK